MHSPTHSPRRSRFPAGLLWLLVLALGALPAVQAAPGQPEDGHKRGQARPRGAGQPLAEYQVKAAFILKFASFIQWPAEDVPLGSEPIEIAVLGEDPFGELLPAEIPPDGENNPAFRVTRINSVATDLKPFQMIFLSQMNPDLVTPLLDKVRDTPILTIGEGDGFTGKGGIIAFTLENNRVRFLVNLKQAQRAGLKISSQLLNLARSVIR